MQPPTETPPPRGKRLPQLAPASIVLCVLGAILLFGGLCTISLGIGEAVNPTPGQEASTPITTLACGALFCVLPSVAMLGFGARSVLQVRRMRRLVGLAETHARLPLDQTARDLGLSTSAVRALLLDAVAQGYVSGRLDLDHGVFFSGDVESVGRRWTGRCESCSAPVDVTLAEGEPGVCPYCRAGLGVYG
jgi:hypothetical protein